MKTYRYGIVCAIALALSVSRPAGAQFVAGNVVVLRVGDGAAALGNTAASVSLRQYTTSGTFVNAMTLASTGASAVTIAGTAPSEGSIGRSQDGQYLLVGGYRANAGTTDPNLAAATTVNRVFARINAAGTVNATTALTDAFNGINIRSVASVDGTNLYGVGGSGVRLAALGATTSTSISTETSRSALVVQNKLYVSVGLAGAPFNLGVVVFDPLPTGTATPTSVASQATGLSQ